MTSYNTNAKSIILKMKQLISGNNYLYIRLMWIELQQNITMCKRYNQPHKHGDDVVITYN